MKHCYLLITSLCWFCACSKDEDTSTLGFAGEYKADNHIVATAINMYTSNGQVTNPTLIDTFIRRHGVDSYFARTDVPFFTGHSLTLSISADQKATLVSTAATDPQNPYTLKTEITARSSDHLVLAEFDSVSLPTLAQANRCDQLARSMMQVQPQKRCNALPPLTGYSQRCRYRPVSVLLVKDGSLRLPSFSWLIVNQQGGSSYCRDASSSVRNLFNTTVLNQLRAGDTIVVQVREVPFIKQ